jgi:hypothetical protein
MWNIGEETEMEIENRARKAVPWLGLALAVMVIVVALLLR